VAVEASGKALPAGVARLFLLTKKGDWWNIFADIADKA